MNSITSRILGILLLICISTSLFTVIYHLNNEKYKTETAIYTSEDDSISFKAVYVRNEEILKYDGAGVVSYTVADGGKLGSGSVIASVYADESQIDVKQRIAALESNINILKKIQNPGTMESAQPANIAALINSKYKTIINAREKGDLSDISADTDELVILLSTYQLMTDGNANFSRRINELNQEYTKLTSMEMVPMDTIKSDKSGYFVSYADGYEDELSMDKLSSITADTIANVSDSQKTSEKNVIGKLITGYEWYIVGIIDNSTGKFKKEEDVKFKFPSTSELISGTIFDIRDIKGSDNKIVVVKCDEITHDLVQHRTERVEMIKGQYKGIKVSRKAIRFRNMEVTETDEKTGQTTKHMDDVKGVYIRLGEQITFKKLDVVYEGDGFVLSAVNAGSDYVSIYDDVIVEGVDDDDS